MIKPVFTSDQVYHIYNRGVEKRNIFLDAQDYFRFIHNLFEFNDEAPAENIYYKLPQLQAYESKAQSYEVQLRKIGVGVEKKTRKLLVEIMIFTLMPNHFHLLLRQKKEGGIVRFMQKLGTGYTNYFNKKYERVGSLFQGRFKAVLTGKESHLFYLPFYIHTNPLDLLFHDWQEKGIKNYQSAMKFLETYRWSSFPDYIDKKNFPSITQRGFLSDFLGDAKQYREDTLKWLKDSNSEAIEKVILE
ncbi:MAG: hypothetical protein UY42_C0037G0002 [Parcubacteria group bacterium GW2011_GWA2_49_16]|nr:MAG: hypothetical protein UY42_C0037G0002 [Parcubacteria group bacterium GW2011_GWA2_49_16]